MELKEKERKGSDSMVCQKVPISQAAREIGCRETLIREKMFSGEWDLGEVKKYKNSPHRGRCYIFRGKLDRFLGIGGQA